MSTPDEFNVRNFMLDAKTGNLRPMTKDEIWEFDCMAIRDQINKEQRWERMKFRASKLVNALLILIGLAFMALALSDHAHAQFSPPFNASSVATLGAPCTSQGSIMFQSANGLSKCLGAGVSGQVVKSGGPGADIAWQTVPGTGTVTSVAATVPTGFTIGGSPITTAGTLAIGLSTEANNTFFAGPSSGGPLAPTWRIIALSDLPSGYPAANLAGTVSLTSQVANTLPFANGGTGATALAAGNVVSNGSILSTQSFSTGQLLLGQAGNPPTPQTMSGDCTIVAGGAITCTKVNGNPLGVAANNVVQLNGSSQLPAVSGALLTNLPLTTGTLVNIQSLSGSGTYTPTAGTTKAIEFIEGAGGGGGGASAAASVAASGGGSGGLIINFDSAPASVSYASGTGGTAGTTAGTNGGNGGATTFSTLSSGGGVGGIGNTGAGTVLGSLGGSAFTGGTVTFAGNPGFGSINAVGTLGGGSFYGGAGAATATVGGNGTACGAGAGGANGAAAHAGGTGSNGCIVVFEFK